jgi:chitodextrinase
MFPHSRRQFDVARSKVVFTLLVIVSAIVLTPRRTPAQASISFVQVNSATPQSTLTTVAVPYTGAQTAGDLNVVVVGWNDATAQVQSVVDSRGNPYQLAVGPTVRAGSASQSIYFAANIAAAGANANTVTVTFSTAAIMPDVRIAEYRGVATTNPLDVTAAATGSSMSTDSGSALTTNANDLLIGANMVQKHTTTGGTSFTSRVITNPDGDILEDRVVTATGTYNATAATNGTGWWIMQMVAFRAASTDTQAPTAPGSPVPSVISSSQINLTWPLATDNVGVTGYLVERCSGAGCSTFAQIGATASASFSDTGLTASTSYSYRVRATDAANNLGPYSSTASATTQPPPAIAFVQVNSATPQSPTAVVSVPFAASQTAGDLNVVVVGWNDATATVQSVADTKGNTYVRAVGPTIVAGFASQSIYYAANIAAAAANTNTVTVTFNSPAVDPDVRIAEYLGIATAGPVDVTAAAQGNSTSSDSGAAITTNANDLLVAANMVQSHSMDSGTSYTSRVITSPDGDILEDRVVTSAGSYNATAPVSPAGWWIMQLVAFRAASADSQAPTAPGTPVPTVVSSTQINLSWSAATDNVGVTGYLVERCAGSGCGTFAQVGTPSTTSFNDTGLSASTTYTYRVRATDAANNLGPYSVTANATTPAPPDTQPPTAPGVPVPTVVSTTQINLAWPTATDNVGVTNYFIERCAGAGCGAFTQVGTTSTPAFNDTGLTASTTYSYRVRATDAANNLGPYSTIASATTQSPPDTQAPTAPGTPVLSVVSSTQINLTWPAATDNVGVTNYFVERCAGGGCSSFAQVGAPTTTSFNDTGLAASTSYTYRVRATDAAANVGPYSATATATTQAPPAISFVQVNSATPQSTVTSVGVTFTAGQTAGDLNVVVVGWNDDTATVQSVTDTRGNVYSRAVGPTVMAGSATQSIYYAANIAAAPSNGNTVTVTFASGAAMPDIRIAEYSGIAASSPVDVTSAAQGTGTLSDSGAVATASANDLLIGANTVQTHATGPGPSYTQRVITSPDGDILEDRTVTATGSYNASATMTSGWWIMQMVAFRGATADTTPPTAPGTPVPTVVSSTQINLTWPAATDNVGVTGYLLERCAGAGCNSFAQIATPTNASFNDTGLTASTSYSYRARATDAAANLGPYSAVASAATAPPPDTQPPTAPGTPLPNVVSSTQINLTWSPATDNVGVTGYLLERCAGAGCNSFAQIATPTSPSFNDTGLTASTSYSYRVRATDAANNLGPYSAVATATTQAPPDTTPPTAPGTPVPNVVSSTQINVTWPAATDNVGVTGYLLERCAGAGCNSFAQIATPTSASFNDTGLTASTSYSYRVRATDAANNLGPYSAVATATTQAPPDTTPPTAPGTPVPNVVSSTQINLTWPAATDNVGVTGYLLERCAGAGCNSFAQIATPTSPSFNDTSLTASTSYSYRVRATDAANNLGPYSAVASATTQAAPDTTPPTAPGTPLPNVVSSTQINLTWAAATDNVGVTGYLLERCAGAGCNSFAQIATPTGASFNDTGLTASTSYSYRVRATDAANNLGPYSTTATAVTTGVPDLTLSMSHVGNFTQGQNGATYTLIVANTGTSSTTGVVTVTDTLPGDLSATALAGSGWNCSLGTLSCTRSDALGAATSYPSITLTVNVSATAAASVTNAAAVSGGGEVDATDDTSTDMTTINPSGGPSPPVFAGEADFAFDRNVAGVNRIDLSLPVSGTNMLLIVVFHSEYDGGIKTWSVTANGIQGTLLVNTNGYNGGANNQRFRIYYWVNPAPGTAAITVQNSYTGSNELAASAVLFTNVNQTNPFGAITLDVSTTGRTSETETLAATPGDVVVHVIADALCIRGAIGDGETSRSVANDGMHCVPGDGDASLWLSMKSGASPTTTVSSSGWASSPSPAPRVINGVAVVLHGAAPIVDTQAPTAPATLLATATSGAEIDLSWTASTDDVGVTGYLVERCQGAGCSNFVQIAAPTAASFADTGVAAGTSYSYRVRATDAAGNLSAYSNTGSATTPAPDTQAPSAPGTLTATAVSGTQVNLNWGAATDNVAVSGYIVQRCQGAGCVNFSTIGTPGATTFTDTGLTSNTSYTYIVAARDTAGNAGPNSNAASVTTPAINPNLIAAYSFNEGSGTTVGDGSGHGNTGTITNATWTAAGKYGNALAFDGATSRVTINDSPSLHLTNGMTLEAWINPSALLSGWDDIIYRGNDDYYLILFNGAPVAGVTTANLSSSSNTFGPSVLPLNTWTHIAQTFDGTTVRLFVNGAQVASTPLSGSIQDMNNPLEIGSDHIFGQYFQGLIDDVRVYNIALTQSQIQADMGTPVGP